MKTFNIVYIFSYFFSLLSAQELKIVDQHNSVIYNKNCKIETKTTLSTVYIRIITSIDDNSNKAVGSYFGGANIGFELDKKNIVNLLDFINDDKSKSIEFTDHRGYKAIKYTFNEQRDLLITFINNVNIEINGRDMPNILQIVNRNQMSLFKKSCEWSIRDIVIK